MFISHIYEVIEDNRQEELIDLGIMLVGTCQQTLSKILRELVISVGFEHEPNNFTISDVINELFGPQEIMTDVESIDSSVIAFHLLKQ